MHECTCQKPAHELKTFQYSELVGPGKYMLDLQKDFQMAFIYMCIDGTVTFYTYMLFEMRGTAGNFYSQFLKPSIIWRGEVYNWYLNSHMYL